jgi:fluoride exporter
MYQLALVALGGGIGAALRHLTNLTAVRLFGAGLPFGTLFINVVGSFAIGFCVEVIARRFGGSSDLRLFIATGILGGFTTFSAFSLDFVHLYERGAMMTAIGYVLASVVLSILAVFAGLWVARHFA